MAKYVVARAAEIPEGGRRLVRIGQREIAVFHSGGRFFALLNRCPHAAGPLCEGRVVGLLESGEPGTYSFDADDRYVSCPWHGWEFSIETGQSYFDPMRTRVRSYPAGVEAGGEIVAGMDADGGDSGRRRPGPYKAEIFPVEVEDEYVVLTLPR